MAFATRLADRVAASMPQFQVVGVGPDEVDPSFRLDHLRQNA
jgi:hypothetical protein